MKKRTYLLFMTMCLIVMALLSGCGNNDKREIYKELDIEQAEKTYMHYAPTIREDVKSVTDADVLEMCVVDQEETDRFNKNFTDGKTTVEICNPTDEMFKYLPDNTESCYIESWTKKNGSENYVYLEYIDDQQIQVGVTYNSQGMKDIYIYFRNENRYVSISDELAYEVLNFGGKETVSETSE